MMLLHSGTFHQESWFPNCSNLVAWLRSDQVMLKAGTWWYQMPRCVSWWRRTSWPWKAPDQGTWTSMQNEDKQTMNNDRRGDAWKFMEILKVCVSICFSKRIFGFFGYAWDLGGAALLTYPVLRYSPVLCGHWKGGVWWALNWLRLKVLGIVCLFEYLVCWAILVLYFSIFLHVFALVCMIVLWPTVPNVSSACPNWFKVAGMEGRYTLRPLRDFDHHTGDHLLQPVCTLACLNLSQSPMCPVDFEHFEPGCPGCEGMTAAGITSCFHMFPCSNLFLHFCLGCHIVCSH